MSARTVLTLADGRNIDLLDPKPADFMPMDWVAEHLAKENRYNGATPGICYSVAQHICEGAGRALLNGERDVAQYFLLHDNHEALFKDDTTPKKRALAEIAAQRFGILSTAVIESFDELTDRADQAIHEAAGLAWPPSRDLIERIKYYDKRMLLTEWRDLMGGIPLPNAEAYSDVEPFDVVVVPFPRWIDARNLLLVMWRNLLPALQTEAL